MKALRILGSTISIIILTIVLFAMGLAWAIAAIFASPEPMKQAFAKNDIYPALVKEGIKDSKTSLAQLIKINKDYANEVARAMAPYAQQDVEAGIDGLFVWISGGSDEFDFTTDLRPAREEVIEITSNYNFKPALMAQLKTDATWEKLIIPSDTIGDREDILEEWQPIKQWYPVVMAMTWVLPILAVGLIGLLMVLAPALRNGMRRSGIAFVIAGPLLLAVYFAGAYAFDRLAYNSEHSLVGGAANTMQGAFVGMVTSLGNSALVVVLWTGISFTLIGLAALIVPAFMKKTSK
jgi:hypothetical protein